MFGNGRHGFRIATGSGLNNTVSLSRIQYNRANMNVQDGIFINTGVLGIASGTSVMANRTDRNGEDGIDIDSVGYILRSNSAYFNSADGINAIGNTNAGGNVAIGNAACNTPGCF